MRYDCIIVGAGPAGIFAALELAAAPDPMKILLIEKGSDLDKRQRSEVFSGWGGAGTYSDGKLNLTREIGGFLSEYIDPEALSGLIDYVDEVFLMFGAARELKGTDHAEIAKIQKAAAGAGLRLIPFPIRHLGTDRCYSLLENIRAELEGRIDILFNTEVSGVMHSGGAVTGVRTAGGAEFASEFVLLCPGRTGSGWLKKLAEDTGIGTTVNPVDVGVRVEVPATVLSRVTDALHEAKLTYRSKKFDDLVRTFCMNPYGVVVREKNKGFFTVNGHSFSTKKSDNTNFALLVSTTFTEPFKEPVEYGQHIARLANMLGGGPIVQRLGDLMNGRRSTPERIAEGALTPTLAEATPGDLSFVLPYRYLTDILEMLEALDKFAPGINDPSTLLYGVEVKFYSMRLKLGKNLETGLGRLYAAGDGAGVTRSIIQAAVSGVIAARDIISRGAEGGGDG